MAVGRHAEAQCAGDVSSGIKNSRKVGRHAHGLLRLEHRSGKALMVGYQGVKRAISEQLGHPCRVHFQLIRCKPEWSFDSVRSYITKQQMGAHEANAGT
jgi:hypothetical protein